MLKFADKNADAPRKLSRIRTKYAAQKTEHDPREIEIINHSGHEVRRFRPIIKFISLSSCR
jgi:hypothetical protein